MASLRPDPAPRGGTIRGVADDDDDDDDDRSDDSSIMFVSCTPGAPGRRKSSSSKDPPAGTPAPPPPRQVPSRRGPPGSIAVPAVRSSSPLTTASHRGTHHSAARGRSSSSTSITKNASSVPPQQQQEVLRRAPPSASKKVPPAKKVSPASASRRDQGLTVGPLDLATVANAAGAAVVSHSGSNESIVDNSKKANASVATVAAPNDDSGTTTTTNNNSGVGNAASAAAVDEDQENAMDADDDESSQEDGPGPTTFKCWMCLLDIVQPFHDVRRHPLLSVAVCQCCSDQLECLQESLGAAHTIRKPSPHRKSKGKDDDATDEDDDDDCAGCRSNEGQKLLFLCDSCPKQFCEDCVAYAHRAGFQNMDEGDRESIVAAVQAQDPWQCLACQPPPHLRSLQEDLRTYEEHDDGDDNYDDDGHRSENQQVSEATLERKYHKWSNALLECEEELKRVLDEFEMMGPMKPDESDDTVEDRLLLERHHKCLCHKISHLHDDLEGTCGVDLSWWYKSVLGEVVPNVDVNARPTEDVEAADREIRERYAQKDRERYMSQHQQPGPSLSDLHNDEYQDVEDLDIYQGEGTDGGAQPPRNLAASDPERGWRHLGAPPDPQLVERLRQEEDALLQARSITVRRVSERFDREATRTEDHAEKKQRRKRLPSTAIIPTASNIPTVEVPNDKTTPNTSLPVQSVDRSQDVGEAELAAPSQVHDAAADVPSFESVVDPPPTKGVPEETKLRPSGAHPVKGDKGVACPEIMASPTRINSQLQESSDEDDVGADGVKSSRRKSSRNGPFTGPEALVLNPGAERVVTISREIATKLKEHQKEGAMFIWRNCFSDLNYYRTSSVQVNGCVLAHNMGLGKSLTTIALMHSLLNHPNLNGVLKTVLIVAPVNTLANWEDEINKWTGHVETPLFLDSLAGKPKASKAVSVRRWKCKGGIMLVGEKTFLGMKEKGEGGRLLETDILVLDEAHTMLKNSNNKVYQSLSCVATNRRILLTGTPLQNNVTEYFRMIQFANPGAIDGIMDEAEFERKYRDPIEKGLPSDSGGTLKEESVRLQVQLRRVLEPTVHRRGASVLLSEVTHLQQVVLYLRPTREQNRLCNIYKRLQKSDRDLYNFFRMWKDTKKVHNHPGVLTVRTTATGSRSTSPCPSDEAESPDSLWWEPFVKDQEALKDVEKGYKMVVLLHILCQARAIGDKVLVFSSCLRTLDFIESILQRPTWSSFVPTLEDEAIGLYKKNHDYVRIDGSVSSDERGARVTQFNEIDNAMLFLISSRAGGIGINLPAANRVVLFDSDFNPTIATQCIYRAYRYGQTKPVFCYRLLTEGKMEEKIYARSVTKQGVSYRVIDGRESMNRCFTAQELDDMRQEFFWVQCDECDRWRCIPQTEDELPPKWYCKMNVDVQNNSCEHEERDQKWYEDRLQRANAEGSSLEPIEDALSAGEIPEQVKLELVKKDDILQHVLGIKASKRTPIVSRYEFHQALLDADDKATPRDKSDAGHHAGDGPPYRPSQQGSTNACLKESNPNAGTPKKLATASPAKATLGASSPATSEAGQKRGPPAVRSTPARKSKQAKASPFVLSDSPNVLGVGHASAAKAKATSTPSQKAVRNFLGDDKDDDGERPRFSPSRKAVRVFLDDDDDDDDDDDKNDRACSSHKTMPRFSPSRKAVRNSLDDGNDENDKARSSRKKIPRLSAPSPKSQTKITSFLPMRSRRSSPAAAMADAAAARSAASATTAVVPRPKASEPELIDLCDSD